MGCSTPSRGIWPLPNPQGDGQPPQTTAVHPLPFQLRAQPLAERRAVPVFCKSCLLLRGLGVAEQRPALAPLVSSQAGCQPVLIRKPHSFVSTALGSQQGLVY